MKLLPASLLVLVSTVAAAQPRRASPASPPQGTPEPSQSSGGRTPAPASEDVDIARAHFNTGQAYY
jgi:hypothetical protein